MVYFILTEIYSKGLIHTWASLQSWEGYPPPEFFLISTPPLQEGLSWAKYSPPRKNFWANYLKISPPRKNIFGKFQENSGILVKSCKGYPPLWGWKIYPPPKNFQKNIPPLWNFWNLSPPGSRVLAHVWLWLYQILVFDSLPKFQKMITKCQFVWILVDL